MTYQRNMSARRLEVEEDVAHEALEDEVGRIEVGADDRHGDDDDDGRGEQLLAAGPLDLLELAPGLRRERPDASAPLALGARLALRLTDVLDGLAALARALGVGRRLEALALAPGPGRTGPGHA